MSKQANTTLIGGFVVGAIALVVIAILLLGSGKLFSRHEKFVLFFEDSVNGLGVGAPVDFKGVKIGTVSDINVMLDKKDLSLRIPVFVEIDPGKITFAGSEAEFRMLVKEKGTQDLLELLIKQGLRAQLVMQSLVTGRLGIHLDFFPHKPVRLVGAEPGYTEIPTVESPLSEIARTVQKIPLSEIADKLLRTLDSADKLLNSPDVKDALAALPQTVKAAHTLLVNLDGQLKPLAAGAKGNLKAAKKMFSDAAKLADKLNAAIPPVVARMNETFKTAGATMKGANEAIDGIAGDNSPVRIQLMTTLNELASAARSFRILADYIDNHPEALVRGKGK